MFSQHDIEIVVPDEKQIKLINARLFKELVGVFKETTKQELLVIVNNMKNKKGIDSVILDCTEFPLMFTKNSYLDLPFLNTTRIHVNATIKECLKS